MKEINKIDSTKHMEFFNAWFVAHFCSTYFINIKVNIMGLSLGQKLSVNFEVQIVN